MAQHDLKKASKVNWTATVSKEGEYPGDMNVVIGCLQRIAEASEMSARRNVDLQNENDFIKKSRDSWQAESERLYRKITAMKGVITKLRKKL